MSKFYNLIRNNDTTTTLELLDAIGADWGIAASEFARELSAVDTPEIRVVVNSLGGSVFEGLTIYNLLAQHEARVTVEVVGVAASIASVVAMAADELLVSENAWMMIHNPWSLLIGDSDEMRKTADLLDALTGSLIKAYMRRAKEGYDEEYFRAAMAEETWYDAGEAEKVFGAKVVKAKKIAAKFDASNVFGRDLSHIFTAPPTAGEKQTTKKGDNTMDAEKLQNRVDALEAEKTELANKRETDIQNARLEAIDETAKTEADRKAGILSVTNKYNQDGDLDAIAIEALAGDTTVQNYRDQVMDVMAKRPVSNGIKPDASATPDLSEQDKLRNELKNETNPAKRAEISRKLRELR